MGLERRALPDSRHAREEAKRHININMAKHVVFDIVGTLVSFDAFYDRIDEVIGEKLRSNGISPQLFGYTWMT